MTEPESTVPMSVRALKTGAIDSLQKPIEDQLLLDAIHQALEWDRQAKVQQAEHTNLQRLADTLTRREHEVFSLVVTGLANKEIAAVLGTREKTVKIQRGRLMQKMRAPSLAHLVRMAALLEHRPSTSKAT
jgi:FixJ family two-component response regulator